MQKHRKVTVKFYPGFLDNEIQSLPDAVREALLSFLARLQDNPDDMSEFETEKGRFAHEFIDGFVVYWRLIDPLPAGVTEIGLVNSVRIDVLEVTKLHKHGSLP